MPYLSVEQFTVRTVAPSTRIDEVQAAAPGWLDAQLATNSALIDSILAKRYATPFASPAPEPVLNWLTRLVTTQLYFKVGFDPTDAQAAQIMADQAVVMAELKEAANAATGMYELPLRSDQPTSRGIAKRSFIGRADQTPFDWQDRQLRAVRGY